MRLGGDSGRGLRKKPFNELDWEADIPLVVVKLKTLPPYLVVKLKKVHVYAPSTACRFSGQSLTL
jgi:hypothetical protein